MKFEIKFTVPAIAASMNRAAPRRFGMLLSFATLLLHREPGGVAVNNRHDDSAVTCHRSSAECRLAAFHAGSWTGLAVAGENLAGLFSTSDPTTGSPRLRLRNVDPKSKTWKSAHEGAAALIRAAFMGVRNLVSHPDGPSRLPARLLRCWPF
jgi:hypothetical protein